MSDELMEKIVLKPRELAETLIRSRGIHEGFWMLSLEFKALGSNTGPTEAELYPTVMVPITGIGIQRFAEANPMTVDAAKVNPAPMTDTVRTTS